MSPVFGSIIPSDRLVEVLQILGDLVSDKMQEPPDTIDAQLLMLDASYRIWRDACGSAGPQEFSRTSIHR